MKPKTLLATAIIGLLFGLAACNVPTPRPQVISPQDAANTAAASTVIALSTELAAGKNPTLAIPTGAQATPAAGGETPGSDTLTPEPTAGQGETGGSTPDPNLPCNQADFVQDITIPDGSVLPANSSFVKTWELKNTGGCAWNNSYQVVFAGSGDAMSAPAATALVSNGEVKPGESVKVSVSMRAPGVKGKYAGRWQLRAPDGKTFGLGANGAGTFYVEIQVDDVYNFAELYCSAAWSTGAGELPCPGKESDSQGAVVQLKDTNLENGNSSEGMSLLTIAQPNNDGYIVGHYPAIMVPQGADFRANLGCQNGAAGCFIRFKVTVSVDNGPEQTLGEWNEGADGNTTIAIADLDAYAGKPTAFNLYLYVNGSPNAAKGLWFSPIVTR